MPQTQNEVSISQSFGNERYAYYSHEQINTENAFASTLTAQESVNMDHRARKEIARKSLTKAASYCPKNSCAEQSDHGAFALISTEHDTSSPTP